MEKGTNYSFVVKSTQDLTFQKVKAISDRFIDSLPQDLQEILLDELQCGPQLMETEPSMATYIHACGDRLEAQLQRAFNRLPPAFFHCGIEWIDYDCGLAAGAMVYHDFLKSKGLAHTIRRITLVHPSEACLERAELHVRRFFPQTAVRLVHKPANLLQAADIATGAADAKLHLLTNLRNMDTASAVYLAELIRAHSPGYNQFVCIAPFFGDSSETVARMDMFVDTLAAGDACFAENLEAGRLVADKPWTCALRVFATGETAACVTAKQEIAAQPETPAGTPPPARITGTAADAADADSIHKNHTEKPAAGVRKETAAGNMSREPERKEFDPVRRLLALAEQGNAKAQNNLGFLYELGQDVQQDDVEAAKWYRKAAIQGNAKAQYNLANHYAQGRGVAKDSGEAAAWYRKAAAQGILHAMNHLAEMYATGNGVGRDKAEAVKWYRAAAAQGDEHARRILQKHEISG